MNVDFLRQCSYLAGTSLYCDAKNLFDQQSCAVQWTQCYYKNSQRIFLETPSREVDVEIATSYNLSTSKVLSQHEKYRKAYGVAKKLVDIASDLSMREFPYAMNGLEQIASAWEQGKHVVIQVVDPEFDVSDDGDLNDGNVRRAGMLRTVHGDGGDENNITDTNNGDVSDNDDINEDDACDNVNNEGYSKVM